MSTLDNRKFYYLKEYFNRKGIIVYGEYDQERKEYIITFKEKIGDNLHDLFSFYVSWLYIPGKSTLFTGL